ncbi:hypothetical protein [Kitasatospora sp. NPDC088134]|uniref:hypothetical protein n=1 Tax=Kitasatospora sp. NPDC088134 TaxID=3364071 RepID=UPI0038161272
MALVEGPIGDYDMMIDGIIVFEGCAGLAVALYLLGSERGVDPADVSGEWITAFYTLPSAEWTRRLETAGHGPGERITGLWKTISTEHRASTDQGLYEDFDVTFGRWGAGYSEGMKKLEQRFGLAL